MIQFRSDEERLYFEWLCKLVRANRTYSQLMKQLYDTEFYYIIDLDQNRIAHALELQDLYIEQNNLPDYISRYLHDADSISVLEVLIAMAYKIEDSIMCDEDYGDRTYVWFWMMIDNLGIKLTNSEYNEDYISWVLHRFMNREFEPDGTGSIVKFEDKHKTDARDIEIWHLFCLYLSELAERGLV